MRIVKKNETYFINPKDNLEKQLLNKFLNNKISLKLINKDVLCLVSTKSSELSSELSNVKSEVTIKEKIISLLNNRDFPQEDKVEGRFEAFLKPEDLRIFKQMIIDKDIVVFKLSNKYKKGIYKVNPYAINTKTYTEDSDQENQNKITLDKIINKFKINKYVVIKDKNLAIDFSKKYEMDIKYNKIKGIKSFDNIYYIIDIMLYNKIKEKIMKLKKQEKKIDIISDAKYLKIDIDLLLGVLEFMKEECLLIEKKKGEFYLI